ncbi:hypothetical protein MHI37_18170 [Paenibacillus sp. FSL H8-0548]|nr:hypothetical protein [Paenibacillus sp. FSL H8-0548]
MSNRISDELLDYLADWFVSQKIWHLYRITLEQFIDGWQQGYWRDWA